MTLSLYTAIIAFTVSTNIRKKKIKIKLYVIIEELQNQIN